MRINIEIDDELLSRAMAAAGLATKLATVEEGLRLLVRLGRQAEALADIKGLGWDGPDLNDNDAEIAALAAAVAQAQADGRSVPHEAVRAWLLRLADGDLAAEAPALQ